MQNAISVKNGVIPSDTPTNKKAKKQLINISLKSFKPKDTVLVPVLTPVLPAPVPVDEVVTPPPSTPSRQDSASAKSRTPGLLLDNYEDETEEKPTLIFPTANAFTHDVQPSAAQQHAALFDNSGSEVFNKNEPSKVTYIPKETNLMAPGSEQNQQFHLWVLDEKQQKFLGDLNINKPFLTFGSSSAACHVIDRAVSVYSTHAALCFLDNKHPVLHSAGGNIRMWLTPESWVLKLIEKRKKQDEVGPQTKHEEVVEEAIENDEGPLIIPESVTVSGGEVKGRTLAHKMTAFKLGNSTHVYCLECERTNVEDLPEPPPQTEANSKTVSKKDSSKKTTKHKAKSHSRSRSRSRSETTSRKRKSRHSRSRSRRRRRDSSSRSSSRDTSRRHRRSRRRRSSRRRHHSSSDERYSSSSERSEEEEKKKVEAKELKKEKKEKAKQSDSEESEKKKKAKRSESVDSEKKKKSKRSDSSESEKKKKKKDKKRRKRSRERKHSRDKKKK
eukprot:Platyproteum_vivax@DN7619_c0_g1_i2.p1